MKKILIMGCPGSGKPRLALRLGRITGFDVYHIKDDTFSEKHTNEEKRAWRDAVKNITIRDSWIIEGTQSITYDIRIKSADTVFFLRETPLNCLWSFIKKSLKKKIGREKYRMSINRGMIKKIIAYRKIMRPLIDDLLEKNKTHLDVKIFNNQNEADEYLLKLREEYS